MTHSVCLCAASPQCSPHSAIVDGSLGSRSIISDSWPTLCDHAIEQGGVRKSDSRLKLTTPWAVAANSSRRQLLDGRYFFSEGLFQSFYLKELFLAHFIASMALSAQEKELKFKEPRRCILNVADLETWQKCPAYRDLIGFVQALNESVKRKELSEVSKSVSDRMKELLVLLDTLNSWIDEIPPEEEQVGRFGNKSYRKWHERLVERCPDLIKGLLPEKLAGAVVELKAYFTDAFGNSRRIDYGSGHEANFIAFLCCLCKLGVISQADSAALVLIVFDRYLALMRRLQTTYRMEPAGSQGVWGLDDHQFLPFYFGSAQLMDNGIIEPKHFPEDGLAEKYVDRYMFMGAVAFISKVKTGPFAEHSNVLWNISAVRHWSKVNSGLLKMFKAEVLGKFPVMQHFVCGTLLAFTEADDLHSS